MSRKEYEMMLKLNAQLGSQFGSSFKSANATLAKLQDEIQSLSKAQGDISAYRKQQAALTQTKTKLDILQKEYQELQEQYDETGEGSTALETKLLKKKLAIEKTTAAVETHERKVEQLGESLHEAGVDTDNLTDESQRLAEQQKKLKGRQEEVAEEFSESGQKASKFGEDATEAIEGLRDVLVSAGILKLIQGIGKAFVESAKESIMFESAITGVYKTIDGTDEQLATIEKEIAQLATEIPASTEEIAGVAEAAGQLGIATEDVMSFTEVMIDLGEATNLTSEEAASAFAKFANITGTSAEDYGRLGAVVVDLGNNFATTEADIVHMSTRLASSGTLAGLTEPEIMALATAMSSVGIEAEAGGTAMTQTLSAIEKAVVGGGDVLNEYARISGMSAKEFADTWKNEPIKAIQAFIGGLGELDKKGESATLVLDDLGLKGVRQSNMLKSLGLAAETLGKSVDVSNKAWDENTALVEEASKRYATTESKLAMVKNSYSNLKVAIGDVFTPTVREASDVANKLLGTLTDFVKEHPGFVKAIGAVAVGVGTFAAALTAYIVVSKVAKAATRALNTALMSNHFIAAASAVLAVVTAIASLAATAEDDGIPAIADLKAETEELKETMETAKETYDDTVASTLATANVADTYISKLEDMEAAGINTDAEAKEYHQTLEMLCQTVPELADHIDLTTDTIDGGTAALRVNTEEWKKNAIAQAMQEKLTEMYKEYSDVLVENEKNAILLKQAQDSLAQKQQEAAEAERIMAEEYKKAEKAAEDYTAQTGITADAEDYLSKEYRAAEAHLEILNQEIEEGEDTVWAYQEAMDEAAPTIAEAESEIALASEATDNLINSQDEATDSTTAEAEEINALNARFMETNSQLEDLQEEYREAYDAAYDSISGQYSLWDTAAEVVATSASTINEGLESQQAYWSDYNTNLENLSARGEDIAGLGDMLASFADGSADSVNAVAGMADATDEELAQMVANWQKLQEEQSKVAGSLADVRTDFSNQMEAIQGDLADDVADMDLSDEARISANNTIQGFINGAYDMLPLVDSTFTEVGHTAARALNSSLDINSPSKITDYSGTMAVTGFINPAVYMQDDVKQAYHDLGDAGAEGLSESQSESTLVSENNTSSSNVTLQISYTITGSAGPELEGQLKESSEHIRQIVVEVMNERAVDESRRRY